MREGHGQLENIVSSLGVSHAFPMVTLLIASLGAGPGRPRQNCSIRGDSNRLSALGLHPHTTHPLPRFAPQGLSLQDSLGPRLQVPWAWQGGNWEPLLFGMKLLHLTGRPSRDTGAPSPARSPLP